MTGQVNQVLISDAKSDSTKKVQSDSLNNVLKEKMNSLFIPSTQEFKPIQNGMNPLGLTFMFGLPINNLPAETLENSKTVFDTFTGTLTTKNSDGSITTLRTNSSGISEEITYRKNGRTVSTFNSNTGVVVTETYDKANKLVEKKIEKQENKVASSK